MAKFSTGLRDKMLNNTGFRGIMNGGRLVFFGGPVPESADAADNGQILIVLDGGGTGLDFGAPSGGVISKDVDQVWMTDAIEKSGTITHFRFYKAGDDGSESTTASRIQGTAGIVGTDLIVVKTAVDAGQPWTLNYFNVALPTL